MLKISKILLPVDFSGRACHAARYALPFAERFQSEVILLHVLPPLFEIPAPEVGRAAFPELIEERRNRVQRQIDSYLQEEFPALRTRRVLLEGDPAGQIIEFAHREHCGLIFMPTHGHGPFRRLLLGSVTAKVLHDADCPVWTGVHLEETPRHAADLRHVVCAIDLGPNSGTVLDWASRIAAEFQARLTVVHSVDSLEPLTESYNLSPEWRKVMIGLAEAELAALQRAAGTHAEVVLRLGPPTKTICAEAGRLEADLLVIGRGSSRGILGRLTEHAYAIIRESPCPAVSV